MRRLLTISLMTLMPAAVSADQRTNPPTVLETSPLALTRGLTNQVTVKGINLEGASRVLFDDPAIQGKVLNVNRLGEFVGEFIGGAGTKSTIKRGDPPPLNEVRLEIEAAGDAAIGVARFRLVTPAGTTNAAKIGVEPYYGARPEIEPNDHLQEVMLQEDYIFLPTIITGTLRKPGDVDYLPFQAAPGEEIVTHITAGQLGSDLRWSLELLDSTGTRLASRSIADDLGEPVLAYRIPSAGKYLLAVSDIERGGGKNHLYRLKIGTYPYLTSVYPLGFQRGEETEVAFRGFNLSDRQTARVAGEPDYEGMALKDLRPEVDSGVSHNKFRLAVGEYPEIHEQELGATAAHAPAIPLPVTVNGRVSGFADDGKTADEDYFRFQARKGQAYVIEVNARRLGSPLDSVVEVLDASAEPVSRAAIRALVATKMVLNDRNSAQDGLRLESVNGFEVGDYVWIGNEILRVKALPRGPDDDFRFDSFAGQRIGYFDTTPEAHAVDTPAYEATLHPPGTQFPPNGLPVGELYFRNDDGGPGYDKDSLLNFTPPADGEYLIRLRDLRGFQGEDYAYRLTLREAQPDFRLSMDPPNPNIPRGGGVAVTVDAARLDGFDGPIEVEVQGLPAGITATRETIAAGETSTVLVFWAAENTALDHPVPLRITGTATIAGAAVERAANPDDKLRYFTLAEPGDLEVKVESPNVTLEAGGKTRVSVSVTRRNGFAGRVPISVLNLPYGVKVSDVGLNGVLVTDEETSREFTLEALPWVEPSERLIAVTGTVETRSRLRSEYAAQPFTLRVAAKTAANQAGPDSDHRSAAPSANQR